MPRKILLICGGKAGNSTLTDSNITDYVIMRASSGREALSLLNTGWNTFSAILLDAALNDIDSFELLGILKKDDTLARIPVIITAQDRTADIERKAFETGAADIIRPPFDPVVVSCRVNRCIDAYETAQRMRVIIAHIPSGIGVASVDESGKLSTVFANNTLYSMFDCTKEQFEAEYDNPYCVICPEDRESVKRIVKKIIREHGNASYEARCLTRDSGIKWVRCDSSAISGGGAGETLLLSVVNDITEEKLLIKREHDSAELLLNIVGNIDGGVSAAMISDSGKVSFLFNNERFYSLLGYTKEQFETELSSAFDVVHPDDRQFITEKVISVLKKREKDSYEYRCIKRNGEVVYIHCNAALMDIDGSDEPALLSVITDITDKVNLQKKENEVKQRMQAIMDNAGNGITAVIVNGDTAEYIFANDRYYEMHGLTKEQCEKEAKNIFSLVYPEDRQYVKQASVLSDEDNAKTIEYRVRRPDGRLVWIRVVLSAAHFSGIDELVQIGIYTDITDGKLAKRQERETTEQLRAIMDNIDSGVSAATLTDGKIGYVFVNDKYYEMFGYTRNQFQEELPNGLTDIIYSDDLPLVYDSAALAEKNGSSIQHEFRVKKRSGETIWIRNIGSTCSISGIDRPVHLAVLNDITEEKQTHLCIQSMSETLQNMMDDTPGGFARMRVFPDGTARTEYVNDTLCRMRNMTREEILSADNADAMVSVHPDDKERVRQAIRQLLQSRDTRRVQYRLLRAGGDYVPCTVFGRITTDPDGRMYINTYVADMTERERKELTERETVFFAVSIIMASTADLSFIKDKDDRYICCSHSFAKMVGLERDEDVNGLSDYDLFEKDLAEKYRADDMRLFEKGESLVDYIEELPTVNGMRRYSNTSKFLLRDTLGEVIGIYGTARDITESRESFAQLKLLNDSIPGGIASYIISPSVRKLTYFNDSYCRMLGYSRDEYETRAAADIVFTAFDEDKHIVDEMIDKMLGGAETGDCVIRIHCRDGAVKWASLNCSVGEWHNDALYVNVVMTDVTSLKLTEASLRVHEEEIKLALSKMSRIFAEYDIEKRILLFPDTYCEKYGFPAVACNVPESMKAICHMDDETYEIYLEFYKQLVAGMNPEPIEIVKKMDNGAERWERLTAYTVFNDAGEPVKALIAADNTTEQHRRFELEQNRPKTGEKNLLVYTLFNLTTRETMEYSYHDGRIVPNENRLKVLTREVDLSRFILDEEDREKYTSLNNVDELVRRFEKGETETSFDYRRILENGDVIWARNVLRLMRDPVGGDILLFEYMYDISEEMIQQLMYKSVISNNYDYIARIDGRNGHFSITDNANVHFGMPPASGDDIDAAYYTLAQEFVHPDDMELVLTNTRLAGIKMRLEENDKFQFAFRLVRPDGEICYKKVSQYYLDRRMETIVVTREDVTQIMRQESEQKAALAYALKAANQASLAKSTFLSHMSHELRTPMNAIIGLSALSASELDNKSSIENNIKKIEASARYLLTLINEILEMSRIESGKTQLNIAPFELEQLISNVNAVIFGQAATKGINYDTIIKNRTAVSYDGDITKLQEILVNILGNAVKFTHSGGSITLTAEQLERAEGGVFLRFTAADTGIGIDESFMEKLFEPFAQESADFTSDSSGTGLGLSITKKLIELMGGSIEVNSRKGCGSVFTVDVPLVAAGEDRAVFALANKRILIADENIAICGCAKALLESAGASAECAGSVQSALELTETAHAQSRDFDVIFIDCRLLDMGGMEAVRRLKKAADSTTKVIITAYDLRSIDSDSIDACADTFMEKPLFLSTFLRAFESATKMDRAAAEPRSRPAFPDLSGKHFLLAEDQPLNVEVAKRLIEKTGASVIVACNGLEALNAFSEADEGYFDLILMDIRMPILDGLAAARKIRGLQKKDASNIPIIAMTANAFDDDVERSLESGMNAHLNKPIDPKVMFYVLDKFTS